MQRRLTNGFTLLELLAVVIVMGLMLAIGIPAVMSLMKSTNMSSAARQVSSTFSLARQYAITQRSWTRVVFPYNDALSGLTNSMWYNSYAVVLCTNTANRDFYRSWQFLSQWEYLPDGTVFRHKGFALPQACFIPNATNPALSNRVWYIEFDPTGAATGVSSASHRAILIHQGYSLGGTQNYTYAASGGDTQNVVEVSAALLTGRVKITRP